MYAKQLVEALTATGMVNVAAIPTVPQSQGRAVRCHCSRVGTIGNHSVIVYMLCGRVVGSAPSECNTLGYTCTPN